jgi:carboxylesterase
MTNIIPGCEPFSSPEGTHGALVLHGFTGNPQSMRGLAQAFAAAGFATELPLLPGHGTTVEDMAGTAWDDWTAAADAAYTDLAARTDKVVVAGLSMGGALTAWLAAKHPEIAGIVVINAVAATPAEAEEMRTQLQALVDAGTEYLPAVGNDVADPEQRELAYEQSPVRCLISLFDGLDDLGGRLADVRCPVLVVTSTNDHVVPPASSDTLAAAVSGPVTRVTLERSYHVATLDYDRDVIEREAVEFAKRVTA